MPTDQGFKTGDWREQTATWPCSSVGRAHSVGFQRNTVKVINTGGDTLADEVTGSIPVTATIAAAQPLHTRKEIINLKPKEL